MAQTGVTPFAGVPFRTDWKRLYQCAILELDPTRLPQRIADARHAILDRAGEITTKARGEESPALGDALRSLWLLDEVLLQVILCRKIVKMSQDPRKESRVSEYFMA
jgi:hypothetical protein